MGRDDVIRAMRESGMTFHLGLPHETVVDQLSRFADLVIEADWMRYAKALAAAHENGWNSAKRHSLAEIESEGGACD